MICIYLRCIIDNFSLLLVRYSGSNSWLRSAEVKGRERLQCLNKKKKKFAWETELSCTTSYASRKATKDYSLTNLLWNHSNTWRSSCAVPQYAWILYISGETNDPRLQVTREPLRVWPGILWVMKMTMRLRVCGCFHRSISFVDLVHTNPIDFCSKWEPVGLSRWVYFARGIALDFCIGWWHLCGMRWKEEKKLGEKMSSAALVWWEKIESF